MVTGVAAIEIKLLLLVNIGVIFIEGAPSNAEENGFLVLIVSAGIDVLGIAVLLG